MTAVHFTLSKILFFNLKFSTRMNKQKNGGWRLEARPNLGLFFVHEHEHEQTNKEQISGCHIWINKLLSFRSTTLEIKGQISIFC
jgi:hypothetical protein